MTSRVSRPSHLHRGSIPSDLLRALALGWCAGIILSAWIVPHPLLHAEWQDATWRVESARRALWLAPFTLAGPSLLAPLIVLLRGRGFAMRALPSNARRPLLIVSVALHAFLALVIAWFVAIARH